MLCELRKKLIYCVTTFLLCLTFTAFADSTNQPDIAILSENFASQPSHADSVELKTYLETQNINVRLISALELSDKEFLVREKVDIVILPYGSNFPLSARDAFINYLKNGGAFISLGGYAFDDLMIQREGKWIASETDDPNLFLSGRRGKPGDWINYQPDQLVIFDPTYHFKRVTNFDHGVSPLPSGVYFNKEIKLEGFPATAMTGNNSPVFGKSYARWYTLAMAYDRFNNHRGSVFGLTFYHDGPYQGSAWAFSGVTNVNLFSSKYPGMLEILRQTIDAIRCRTFLVDTAVEPTNKSSCRNIVTRVANFGRIKISAEFENFLTKDKGKQNLILAPGEIRTITECVDIASFSDYYPFDVKLSVESVFNDQLQQVVIKPESIKRDIAVSFKDNYFHINDKPTFLLGTNQTGIVWFSPDENPRTWEDDLQRMRRFGLRVLRVLHFSSYAARGYEGMGGHSSLDLARKPPAKLIRQTDELVAMCARHGIILMLTLHDWLPVELTDDELKAQKKWAEFWSGRYKNDPHVIFDIQNEPHVQPNISVHVNRMWNDFLKIKYGDDSALKEAWGDFFAQENLGNIPCAAGPDDWFNPRVLDFNLFRAHLVERWINANLAGIKRGNADALATVGFLQNIWQADKFIPTAKLDFSNTHYHGPFERFSPVLKLTDRRFRGQGLSVGEYGAWDAHEARSHGRLVDETENSIRHFLAVAHETLGMGGSMALNWDLKDMNECVFPWGLTYAQDNTAKDWTHALDHVSYFFSEFQPKYESPDLFLVLPDNHRLGGKMQAIHNALKNAVNMLFACHVNFGVINEKAIDELPENVTTLIWPIPYCPDDTTFNSIKDFVLGGGQLYFSGGVGYSPSRKADRQERYKKLGLPIHKDIPPFSGDVSEEDQIWFSSKLGKGSVHFLLTPFELRPFDASTWNPYKEFLTKINYKRLIVEPDDPKLHLFSLPETNGNRIYTLFRCEKDADARSYYIKTELGTFKLSLRGMETGLAEISPQGKLISIEGTGSLSWRGQRIVETDAHVMVRSHNGGPLQQSRSIWILPTRSGNLNLYSAAFNEPYLEVCKECDSSRFVYHEEELDIHDSTISINIKDDISMYMLHVIDKSKQK